MLSWRPRPLCFIILFDLLLLEATNLHYILRFELHFSLRSLRARTQQSVRTSRHGLLLLLHSRQVRSWENRPAVEISWRLGSLALTAAFDALSHLLDFSCMHALMILLELSEVESQTCRHVIHDIISSVHRAFTHALQAILISFGLLAFSTLLSALVFHHARVWKLYILLEIVGTFSVAIILGQSTGAISKTLQIIIGFFLQLLLLHESDTILQNDIPVFNLWRLNFDALLERWNDCLGLYSF